MALICFKIQLLDEHGKCSPDTMLHVFYTIGADVAFTDQDGWVGFEKECGSEKLCKARVMYQDEMLGVIEAENGSTFSFSVNRDL